MTTGQGSYADTTVTAGVKAAGVRRSARAVSGAGLLSAAMVLSGVLTYGFLVLAARSLGPSGYGRIGVLWGAMFIAAIVLFRPLEQTASRSISDRRARGDETRSVITSVGRLGVALFVVAGLVAAVSWSWLTNRLFEGDSVLTAFLVAGVAFYGLSYLVRGLVGGALWFDGYGINILADGIGRLALGLPLVFIASRNVAAAAIVGAGLIGAVAPVVFGRKRLQPLFASGEGIPVHTTRAVRFAVPAAVIAAADQLLVNGAPLFVMASGGAHAGRTAGIAFAATMLVRAPVYVFQGVAAALLPNMAQLNATGGLRRLRREVTRTAGLLLGVAAVIAVFCAVAGPLGMRVLYGHEYSASRQVFVALGVGVGLYLVAATLSQALLAIDAGARAAWVWASAGILLIGAYALLPGGEIARVADSFAIACLALLVGLCWLVYRGTAE